MSEMGMFPSCSSGTTAVTVLAPEDVLVRLADAVAARIADRLGTRDESGWMDTKTAAEYAGCSVHSLRKAMAAREVEFRQDSPGGKAWFRAEWIDAWRGL